MRSAGFIAAGLLALIGLVWMGQGLGYIRGSFMTGQMSWFWIGLGCLLVAIVVAGFSRLRRA